ncbi:MAG: hypothetical protein ABIF77_01360 [bacterium]
MFRETDRSIPRWGSLLLLLTLLFFAGSGCDETNESLGLQDLTEAELRYVTRFVVLERARAVAMVQAERGTVLLDSLNTAWGDSSLPETLAGLSREPKRAAAVNDLLVRILDAERDSLVEVPKSRRLTAPLPDPSREIVSENPSAGSSG